MARASTRARPSAAPVEPPVKVFARVRVLERRVRLTPLAILELLATERIEPALWLSLGVGGSEEAMVFAKELRDERHMLLSGTVV